jgi:hypothetical protein
MMQLLLEQLMQSVFVMVAEKIGSETLSQIVQMVNDASRSCTHSKTSG